MTRLTPLALILAPILALTACIPLETYYREGVSVSKLARDETACDVKALRDAPVATELRRNPPVFVPVRTYCDSNNNCVQRGGYLVDGGVESVDVNKRLRGRVKHLCMQDLGYRAVEIPRCSNAVAEAAPDTRTTRLPRLTSQTCAIKKSDGSVLLVEQR